MGPIEETSYSIPEMETLMESVVEIKNKFSILKNSLAQNIEDIHNYWNTNDPTAESLYNDFKAAHGVFDQGLVTGEEKMKTYITMIEEQIEKYGTAATNTKKIIG